MQRTALAAVMALWFASSSSAQITSFPHHENFDQPPQPAPGWALVGFTLSTSSPRSSPNCLSSTGNTQPRHVRSPAVDLGARTGERLTFYERRTTTALRYRLSLSAINEDSTDIRTLGRWDSAATANSYIERSVDLAAAQLDAGVLWRFVWEVLRDSTNTTGVLRIDDVTLTAVPAVDVMPTRVSLLPARPVAGEPVVIRVMTVNAGGSPVPQAGLRVSWQASAGDPGDTLVPFSLPGLDSAEVSATLPPLPPGDLTVTVRTIAEFDEGSTNDVMSGSFYIGVPSGGVVVSEIMFAPVRENEPEWVELFNPGPWSIPIHDLELSDNGSTRVSLGPSGWLLLAPQERLVIAKTEDLWLYFPSAPFITAAFPSLNNTTPDAVVVRDRSGRSVDSVWYHPAWSTAGRSLERLDWDLPSTAATSWLPSIDPLGATPGLVNSVQREKVDAECRWITAAVDPVDTSRIRLVAMVGNVGREPIVGSSLAWFRIDDAPDVAETLVQLSIGPLGTIAPSDSLRAEVLLSGPPAGWTRYGAVVVVAEDARRSNDTAWCESLRPHPAGSVIVNEAMLEPAIGRSEWIEITNISNEAVDVGGWMMTDLPTASGASVRSPFPDGHLWIAPRGFAVIAADSTILEEYPWLEEGASRLIVVHRSSGLGLNNDGDGVILRDRSGATIDSVSIDAAWHVDGVTPTGRSLERRSTGPTPSGSDVWTSCADPLGGTPGRPNSVSRQLSAPAFRAWMELDPFSPDGDGIEDATVVRFESGAASVFLDVRVFDLAGREVRRLADGLFSAGRGELGWDGRADDGRRLAIGVYVVLVQSVDALTGDRRSAKLLSAVAR